MVLLAGLVLGVAVFGIVGGAALMLTSSQGRVNARLQQFVATDVPAPTAAVTDLRKQKRADLFAQIDARLDRVAREADEPSRGEYLRVVRALSLGAPLDQTLRSLAERVPSEDMDMLVTAISIQQQTGGNLGQTLDLIATTVRERHRIQREI